MKEEVWKTVEAVAPSKEIIDVIKENGGDAFSLCYQDNPTGDLRSDGDRK